MIIIDLFDIDIHIFTVIKFLFNLVVRFKYTDADNIVCCRDLLLNETVVNNHIFSATATKVRKYKGWHDNACENGRPSSSIVPRFQVHIYNNNYARILILFMLNIFLL